MIISISIPKLEENPILHLEKGNKKLKMEQAKQISVLPCKWTKSADPCGTL
jgi:hypothetical protein